MGPWNHKVWSRLLLEVLFRLVTKFSSVDPPLRGNLELLSSLLQLLLPGGKATVTAAVKTPNPLISTGSQDSGLLPPTVTQQPPSTPVLKNVGTSFILSILHSFCPSFIHSVHPSLILSNLHSDCRHPFILSTLHYRLQRSWGKVIFSQASVILSTGGLLLGGVCYRG